MTLSLFHRYPGPGVVLDCIDSQTLPSFIYFTYTPIAPIPLRPQILRIIKNRRILEFVKNCKGALTRFWKINMGVCLRLEFDNIMFIDCLEYDFYIYGAFEFLCYSIAYL